MIIKGIEEKNLLEIVEASIKETFQKNGIALKADSVSKMKNKIINSVKTVAAETMKNVPKVLSEAVVRSAKEFTLKTEQLSPLAKRAHEALYRNYISTFNNISIQVDAAKTSNANSNNSEFRSLKLDETFNLNGVKLHELYFANISDLDSQISTGSIPHIRLARNFGSFEAWQFNFIACCMSARNGWAVVCYDPFTQQYHNIVIDDHASNVPLMTLPVLVMDMWEHAWFKDYAHLGKKEYVVAMMKEINWSIVEARMEIAEKAAGLVDIYNVQPVLDNGAQKVMGQLAPKELENPFDHNQNDINQRKE